MTARIPCGRHLGGKVRNASGGLSLRVERHALPLGRRLRAADDRAAALVGDEAAKGVPGVGGGRGQRGGQARGRPALCAALERHRTRAVEHQVQVRADLLLVELDDHFVAAGVGGPIEPSQVVAGLIFAMVHELHALAGQTAQLRAGGALRRAARGRQAIPRPGLLSLGQIFGDTVGHRRQSPGGEAADSSGTNRRHWPIVQDREIRIATTTQAITSGTAASMAVLLSMARTIGLPIKYQGTACHQRLFEHEERDQIGNQADHDREKPGQHRQIRHVDVFQQDLADEGRRQTVAQYVGEDERSIAATFL